jgi:hypothetical protein
METAWTRAPDARSTGPTSVTSPLAGAWTGALTTASTLPMTWPRITRSPFSTRAEHGAPRCCESGTLNSPGTGARLIGSALVASLRSAGWTPPWKARLATACRPLIGHIRRLERGSTIAATILHSHGRRRPRFDTRLQANPPTQARSNRESLLAEEDGDLARLADSGESEP